ncbi:hypothetical protein [Ruegeria jejuensis]|uniref:hypothetical protein n=1 Tax=Ruegeria jejuensis TaxID=3233338 RepID=UPI00355B5058
MHVGWRWVFWAVVLLCGASYWATGPKADQVVAYSAHCRNGNIIAPMVLHRNTGMTKEQLRQSIDDCDAAAGRKTLYSVNALAGTVTFRVDNQPFLAQRADCTILDANNWDCEDSEDTAPVGFLGGFPSKFSETANSRNFFVNRWQFIILRWIGPSSLGFLKPEQQVQM